MPNIKKSKNCGYYTDVLWCCLPLTAMSCYYYGPRPALLVLVAIFAAYLCDCAITPLHGAGYRPHEPSSECFAALIALLMPATVTYQTLILAVVVSVLAKEAFGGEGHYPFHPAAVGLVVAVVCWPSTLSSYPAPGTRLPLWDVSAVPLTQGMNATIRAGGLPTASTMNLLTGNVAGPMGAGAALVLCACGLFLLCRGHLKLSVFIPYIVVCLAIPWLFPPLNDVPTLSFPWEYFRQKLYLEKYMLLTGATLFGGLLLACEPVTQPNRTASRIIYGLVLGGATVAFRYFSEYETGVCFALIIVGAIPEWLDRAGRKTERMKFMKKEEKRLAKHPKPQ